MSQTKKLQWYNLGHLSDIPVRGARRVIVEGLKIGIFRTAADQLYAIEDRCPHKEGPLTQGIVHDNCVTCPLHNWVINLENGEAQGADDGSVTVYPVELDNGVVRIAVGEAEKSSAVND